MKSISVIFTVAAAIYLSTNPDSIGKQRTTIQYPVTKKINQVDDYFGTKVPDPYRWLENDTAKDTKEWVIAQQKFSEDYLSKIPFRQQIHNRLEEIMNMPRYSGGSKAGDYIFFLKNDGLQNQSVLYFQKGLQAKPEVFIDPNLLSKDGSVSVSLEAFSNDKKYVVYHINKAGSDWETVYIMDIAAHKQLNDQLEWVKLGGAAWQGHGFYYCRYDKPLKGTEFQAKNQFHKVYYHKLGAQQENDRLIYEDKEHPLMYFSPQVTEDERFLFIYKQQGTEGMELLYKELSSPQKDFRLLFKGFKYNYRIIDNIGSFILVLTNDGADNYRLVQVDPSRPEKQNWKDIIPEKPHVLKSVTMAGGKIFANYLKDASTSIFSYTPDGRNEHEITLPGFGTASAIHGFKDDKFAFYDYFSFTTPPSIYLYNISSGKSQLFKMSETKINTNDYTTDQVFYNSKDGTKIPMFILYKKGLKLDGKRPTLLYGYGGFNISITPYFSASRFILLENDGVYAVANIRGGGEYGEKWHNAGKLLNKQNVFDDFIAAAEYLIKNKYTSSEYLAINGGSNGGLLVGACMTQKPALFKIALPEVSVLDMLRFQKFTVGWGWTVEYGSSDSAKYFPYLYKYSPLHNIKANTEYPATMILTADHDDRVVPTHSFKFAATLQEKQKGENLILIRIESKQGHGAAGASLSKTITREADKWAFMFFNMGINPK